MVDLEKIKQEKCQSPPFKRTCPCTILPPPFLIFQIPPPPLREVITIYSPLPFKKGGGSKLFFPYVFLKFSKLSGSYSFILLKSLLLYMLLD